MVRQFLMWCLAAAVLAAWVGCDAQGQQDDFAADAFAVPSGFTETDADGRVLDGDADDWRTAPVYVGRVRVDPAYPNPPGASFVTIALTVHEFDAVPGGLELAAFDARNRLVPLQRLPEAEDFGTYFMTFSPALLGRSGLVRVFLLDGTGELVSYGDILVE